MANFKIILLIELEKYSSLDILNISFQQKELVFKYAKFHLNTYQLHLHTNYFFKKRSGIQLFN